MATKEHLLRALEFARAIATEAAGDRAEDDGDPIWQVYLRSKRERAAVYRCLANS